ncbi:MAG: LysM peptidoglycan-binding domain-containing protein [Turicibacter sp.]|nr:LysM peptidoglycan-binding domain-containing protein [Turicibacter sp.]
MNQEMSDTLELNVEKARKAVGSLFDTQPDVKPDAKKGRKEIVVGQGAGNPYYKKAQPLEGAKKDEMAAKKKEVDLDMIGGWPEDDWTFDTSPAKAEPKPPLPQKPIIKAPSTSRADMDMDVNLEMPPKAKNPFSSIRPRDDEKSFEKEPIVAEKRQNLDESQPVMLISPEYTESNKSRYLFLRDDDEFATFRKKYMARNQKYIRKENVPKPAVTAKEVSARALERDRQTRPVKRLSNIAEAQTHSGMSNPARWLVIVLVVVFLTMMTFLVRQNIVVGMELEQANERLQHLPTLESEITRTMLELAELREENERLAAILAVEEDAIYNGEYETSEEGGIIEEDSSEPLPQQPAPPTDTERIHIVAPGDNLSRISVQFYGNDSPENINRIITANNLTNPDNLQVGDRLVIP